MTNDADQERMLDAIRSANFPSYGSAKIHLAQENKLNKGTIKALDSFYDRLTLKNGTSIFVDKKGTVRAQSKNGQFRSIQWLERFVKKFKERLSS